MAQANQLEFENSEFDDNQPQGQDENLDQGDDNVENEVTEQDDGKEEADRTSVPIKEHENIKAALNEERAKRKQFAQEMARMEQRFQQTVQQAVEQRFRQASEQANVPTYEENPAEHLRYKQMQIEQQLAEQKMTEQQRQEYQAYQQHLSNLQSTMTAQEAAFARENQDYYQAVDHLRAMRDRDYQAMGVLDPVERAQLVQNDALFVVQNALHREQDPAAVIYNMARNYGFKGGSQHEQDAEKLKTVQRGQATARSLGSRGSRKGQVSLREVANMTDEEFDNLSDDDWERIWKQ